MPSRLRYYTACVYEVKLRNKSYSSNVGISLWFTLKFMEIVVHFVDANSYTVLNSYRFELVFNFTQCSNALNTDVYFHASAYNENEWNEIVCLAQTYYTVGLIAIKMSQNYSAGPIFYSL